MNNSIFAKAINGNMVNLESFEETKEVSKKATMNLNPFKCEYLSILKNLIFIVVIICLVVRGEKESRKIDNHSEGKFIT